MVVDPNIQSLIEQLNRGNEQAFDRIYKTYSPRVFAFATSLLKDKDEAEEVVQEVFIKVWNKRGELSVNGSFESFLFTMTKNDVLNRIRKTDYHRVFVEYKKSNPEPDPELNAEIHYRELESVYSKAIDKLSPRKKEIFLLKQKYALSHDEIAQKLGLSAKTVRNQIDAASAEIKQLISRVGFTGLLIIGYFIK